MKKKIIACSLFLFCVPSFAQSVWINEINYDNPGTDISEFIEVAGIEGNSLDNFSLVFINGSDTKTYLNYKLSGTIPNEKNGFGTVGFSFSNNMIQNGSPDGIALVKDSTEIIQFLSYKGQINNWEYNGSKYSSYDIKISDDNNNVDILFTTNIQRCFFI